MPLRVERRLGEITADLQRYGAPLQADWQEAVRNGVCPFCGSGPFVVVAQHVRHAHDMNRREFRDLLGVFYSESICDPAYSAALAARSRAAFREGRTGIHPYTPGTKKHLSSAAIALQKAKADRVTSDVRASSGAALSAKHRAVTRDRDERIVRRVRAGEQYVVIARDERVATTTVRAIARRHGAPSDARATYWASRRGQRHENLERGRETFRRNRAVVAEARVRRFMAGETPESLAAEEGISVKSMRAALKRSGVILPDGRAGGPGSRPMRQRRRT